MGLQIADKRNVTIGTAGNQGVMLSYDNRTQGIALIGKNGTGKSSLIHAMINQELGAAATLLLFDPHGELARDILRTGKNANKQVIWITPETTTPFGLNLFETDKDDYLAVERTVNVAIEIFKKLIGNDTSYMPRFEYIMGSIARTIIYANAGYTLAEVPLLLTDLQFSRNASRNLTNPELRRFWQEYERNFWDKTGKEIRPYDRFQYIESVANRISTLLQNELLYRIVSHSRSTVRFADLLESGNCILFSLPMGKLGEGATSLLGSILLAKFAEAIYQRGTNKRRVHVYIDEYGRYFATPFTADLLTQGRKYNCSTLVTMQTLQQLPDETNTAAVLNVGNLLVFATIGKDADTLSRQFPLPDALPEKPDTLSPYIISPTPVQDIWKKGHNSQSVMEVRDKLFILLHRLDTQPYEKVFVCPDIYTGKGRQLQDKFTDMEDYCTNREQAVEAFNQLNEVLFACESYQNESVFSFQHWGYDLFAVFLLLRGYLGFYPQNHKDTEGEYASYLEARRRRYPVDPRQLRDAYEWVPRSIPEQDVGELYDLFAVNLLQGTNVEALKKAIKNYSQIRNYLYKFPSIVQLFKISGSLPTEQEQNEGCNQRFIWEITNLSNWTTRFLLAVNDLSVMPVMTQSSTYAGQRTTERPVGDMREELSMRLATLPNYTAMCQLIQEGGSTESFFLKTLKG